jgi:hypothetical protein
MGEVASTREGSVEITANTLPIYYSDFESVF